MAYLDELKQQAQVIRGEQKGGSPEARQQAVVARTVHLSLRLIHRYLQELAEQLNVVKPIVSASYDIEGYGSLADLSQQDYTVQVDDPKNIGAISFTCSCLHHDTRPRLLRTPDRFAFLKQRDYLWQHGLQFDSKLTVSGEGTFFLDPSVPMTLRFLPDNTNHRIRLVIKNFDRLGEDSYFIDPRKIDRQRLDGIAGVVLRKPNSLERLTGPLIADEVKARIRHALEQEQAEPLHPEETMAVIALAKQQREAEKRRVAKLHRAANTAFGNLMQTLRTALKQLRPVITATGRRCVSKLRQLAATATARLSARLLR